MVTIKEVADYAGVAISTVSKVLNDYPNVSENTKKKVRQAIDELHYVPNTIAAALSSKQFARVALIVNLNTQTQAIDEITMQYLSGALNKAREKNIEVVTIFYSMLEGMTMDEIVRYFQSQSIFGIIIFGLSKDDKVFHELLAKELFKSVAVDAPFVSKSTSSVWVDNKKAQYDVAKKAVLDGNSHRILYIAGKKNGYVTEYRLEGIRELAQEKELDLQIFYGEFSELKAREIVLEHGKEADLIVCASDLMAIGAMNACIDIDIFRPVCGFDGITLMGYVGKQMLTVRQDFYAVAQAAVEEVFLLLSGEKGRSRILEHKLVKLYYQDIIC
ncbi:MAG: LacI family transcriptional regulator [Lachnospiraceae bacterium]|nr:LacI family transcriptional regulator [Lachnospiraceae bacterium]